jgi:putative addiction module component (TIGR02574 family)
MLREEYKNLSVEEKLILVEELWESIETDAKEMVTEEQKKILSDRLKIARTTNMKGKSREEVKRDLKRKEK